MCVEQQFIVEQPYTLDSSLMVFENAVARLIDAQDFMQNEIIDLGIPDEAQEYIEAEIRLIAAHTEFETALIIMNYLQENALIV
jgi:hypothetical protein